MQMTANRALYENFRHTHGSGAGSGPIHTPRIPSKPVLKHIADDDDEEIPMTAKPEGNKRLKSPNVENWDPDVRLLQSSDKWIGVYGLRKLKLELQQILPTIGFKHSDDFVQSLKKPISARYSKGLFTRMPYKDGSVYNVVATKDKLKNIEKQLQQAIGLYKKRLEWLTSESRRIFGVIEERSVTIVLDIQTNSEIQFDMFIQSLVQVIKEQIMFISKFNLIRVAIDAECWQENAACVTLESIENALDWILGQPMKTEVTTTSSTEAILKSMSDDNIEAVYLFTEGSASDSSREVFKRKLKDCGKQLNVVSFNCSNPSTIGFLKDLSKIGGGRFHAFSMFNEFESNTTNATMMKKNAKTDYGNSSSGNLNGKPLARIGYGLREDVMKIWEELDQARNTLAEIQALHVEFENPQKTMKAIADAKSIKTKVEKKDIKGELYMGSKDWLARNGLRAKKLTFYDFLQTLAFKHCDGVVDVQHAPQHNEGDAVVRQKLVNARYCDRFAHVRWKNGEIMHIHVSGPMHRNYEERILAALENYRKRMEWLQQGSRELFGTIIEDQVAILIDTSSSMASRLNLVKDKLYKLMQEQLRRKRKFNIIKFDSRVQPWRDHVVDCNSYNLDNAWLWVKGLSAGGSTNTLGALKRALTDSNVQAVYLLTDGRPDQPPATVLAQSNLLNTVPIHTISFNCADTEANEFLSQLASETGGRFHYFSEEDYDTAKGPQPFESEDLKLLREEIEKGLLDLQKVNSLRDECARLDWHGPMKSRSSRNLRSHEVAIQRPSSALASSTSIPEMPTSSKFKARPASAKPRTRSAASTSHTSRGENKKSTQHLETLSSHPPATNRASQLRLNASKRLEPDGEWVLKETRDYLDRSRPKVASSIKGGKKKMKQRSRSPGTTLRRWLNKNNLVAKKLTILDALAPTMIPHTTKYVPILDKHVLSKVFDQVLPLAHTSGSDRNEVQIINPQAANLDEYEDKLIEMINKYRRKLDESIFPVLSTDERLNYNGEGVPSFSENRSSMMHDLESSGWPIKKEIIEAIEEEIKQAEIYLSQSKELRETSEKLSKEAFEQQKQMKMDEEKQSKIFKKVNTEEKPSPKAHLSSSTKHLRNQRVVARNALDGFYYHGIVSKCLNSRYLDVDFDSGERQVTSVRYVIPIGGSRPCPTLKAGDYVLVRSKLPTEDSDDRLPEFDVCFVPGIVQVTPLRHRSASKCYTVLRYNGSKVTVLRNDLIKITRSRFIFSCRFIRDAHLASYKRSSPVVLYPLPDKTSDEAERSKAPSVASSRQSTVSNNSSVSEKPSDSGSNKSDANLSGKSSKSSSRRSSNDSSRSSKSSSSHSSSRTASPIVTPQGTPRSVSPENRSPSEENKEDQSSKEKEKMNAFLEEFKEAMEQKYQKQIEDLSVEKQRLEELHQTLVARQEEQKLQQNDIHEQQRRLQEKQQELFQKQLDQQQESQKRLSEEQARLQQQQDDLIKKQRSQHEQMLHAKLSQAQALNMRFRNLVNSRTKHVKDQGIETDKNAKDQQTETGLNNEDKNIETDRSDSRDSQTSPFASRKNSLDDALNTDREKDADDQVDNGGEGAITPEMKMFLSDESEAVLLTRGDHGLLVSRKPPEEDPAVTTLDIPRPIKIGEEVLARWSDDGWYYRGTIKEDCGDSTYYVEDSVGEMERIIRQDIISDEDDANNNINVGNAVVGQHPSLPHSYAPGIVLNKEVNGMFRVRYYDANEAIVPREEIYLISPEKFERDSSYILACEDSLVGQAVVARNDSDGMFHLGAVRERVSGARNYLVEWADQTLQVQNYAFIFGAHTKRHHLDAGDFVLAIADQAAYTYLPGKLEEKNDHKISVAFCNGVTSSHVDPLQSFWISPDYYERVSEYYQSVNAASIIQAEATVQKEADKTDKEMDEEN